MRNIRRRFVFSTLTVGLLLLTVPYPQAAHSAIERDPYGMEKADSITPGWLEEKMKDHLAGLWFERGEQYAVGRIVKTDHVASFEWYEKAAYLGHPEAQFNLGIAYHCGTGVEPNIHLAVQWFTRAAEQGYERAYHSLAHLYGDENEDDLAQDIEKSHALFRKAGENGSANLGLESHLEDPHNISCE